MILLISIRSLNISLPTYYVHGFPVYHTAYIREGCRDVLVLELIVTQIQILTHCDRPEGVGQRAELITIQLQIPTHCDRPEGVGQ